MLTRPTCQSRHLEARTNTRRTLSLHSRDCVHISLLMKRLLFFLNERPRDHAVNSINLQSAGSLPKIGRSVETLINEQRLKLLTPAGAFQLLKPRRRVLSSTRVISWSHGNNKPYLLHKLVGFFFKLGICVKSASFYPTDNGLPSL